jgi:hypothetical protein
MGIRRRHHREDMRLRPLQHLRDGGKEGKENCSAFAAGSQPPTISSEGMLR